MKMICVICSVAVLASAFGVVDATKPAGHNNAQVSPVGSEVVRKDAKVGFMRKAHTSKTEADPVEAAQKGPAADDKEAQKAADKVVKTAPKEETPIADAAEAVGDAVSDGLKELQKGDPAKAEPKKGEAKDASKDATGPTYETKAQDEPEDKEVPSVPGCRNFPKGWADSKGDDCEDYAEGEFCNRHGSYGDGWLDEWGTFEKLAVKGSSATDVCCVCGGGYRELAGGAPGPAPAAAPAAAIEGPILGTKVGRALQGQGFAGELVEHEDGETMTEDWGMEFGPRSGHREIKDICKENPGNEWCDLHGYYDSERKESAAPFQSMVSSIVVLIIASIW